MLDPQHLNKVGLSGFRGLSNLDLDGLGTFNILLGANDVGKTSVLEGIFLLSGPANLQLAVRIQNWRNYVIQEFDGLSPLFHRLDVEQKATLTAQTCGNSLRTVVLTAPYTNADPEQHSVNGDTVKSGDTAREIGQSSSSLPSGTRALQYDVTVQKTSQREEISFSGRLTVRGGEIKSSIEPERVTTEPLAYETCHPELWI